MEAPLLPMSPAPTLTKKMGDFDSCRFDFRIDTKSGLTPHRRNKRTGTEKGRHANYNTLFKCKTCGSLFDSRPALLDHKVLHNEFRCSICEEMCPTKTSLDEHMMVTHGVFNNKPAPKPIEIPHDSDEDEVIVFHPPQCTSPEVIDDDEVFGTSPKKGRTSKSPVASLRQILPSSLPPLVSVGSSTPSSPSLPSSTTIAAAVRNVMAKISTPTPTPTPTNSTDEVSKNETPEKPESVEASGQPSPVKTTEEPEEPRPMAVQVSQGQQMPAMLSPQHFMFSPMGGFPQIRYALPHMMPVAPVTPEASGNGGPQTPQTPQMPMSTPPNPSTLPPGYVYINVPMLINPGGQPNMPQLIPAIPMQAAMQPTPTQPEQPSPNDLTQKKRKLDQADSTTTSITPIKNKRKRTSPEKEVGLVIQDPRSLSSTDYEQNGLGPIKIEPSSSPDLNNGALDFTYKHHPVKQDVIISQVNTKEDNPLNAEVLDLCNSPKEMDFDDDKAAMLEQYRDISLMDNLGVEDSGVSKVDADSTSQSSSTKDDRNTPKDYSCNECEFKAPNGSALTQHKAKAHKAPVKSGLNKLLGKLWQNKKIKMKSEPDSEVDDEPKRNGATEPQPEPLPDVVEFIPEEPPKVDTPPTNDLMAAASLTNFEVKTQSPTKATKTPESDSTFGMFKFHTCKLCKQLFDNVNAMWEHMGTHKELRKFKCTLCNYRAVCRERLVQHKQAEHPEYVKNPWNVPSRVRRFGGKKGPDFISALAKAKAAPEPRGSHHGAMALLQCPEEGCAQKFRTLGGLKNHQMSHLEENCSNDGIISCPVARCSHYFPDAEELDAHLASAHAPPPSAPRDFSCSLCQYKCRQRGSLNLHMKSKHQLEKHRTGTGRTVYVDAAGEVVVDEEKGVGEAETENSLTEVPSPKEIQARVEEVMQHSMPDEHQRFVYNHIEGLGTAGVISYTNEPEEITIDESGPLTIDKLALHDRLKEEEKDVQPIDMSVRKEGDAASELSSNSSSLDLSMYSGEVIRTLGAAPAERNTPYAVSRSSTPIAEKKGCTLEIDSISSPTENQQHFTSVLKLKYVGSPGKETKKRSPPQVAAAISKFFNCQVCDAPFTDATKMWEHRLTVHSDSISIHCDTCPYSAPSKDDLQNHMLSTHGNELGNFKAFICFICGKGYGTKSGLNHHMLRHSEEGPPALPCPFPNCKSKLHSKGSLKMHLRRQHGGNSAASNPSQQTTAATNNAKVVRCRFAGCGKTFSTTKHMKVHQMQHTGEMPLKCHLCEYACRQRNSMNWHMQSKHNLEKKVSEDGRHTYYV